LGAFLAAPHQGWAGLAQWARWVIQPVELAGRTTIEQAGRAMVAVRKAGISSEGTDERWFKGKGAGFVRWAASMRAESI
jgi:hypothetical protein